MKLSNLSANPPPVEPILVTRQPASPVPWLAGLRDRWSEIALLLLCLVMFFWRLGSVPLFDLDEGLYVTCAKQMVISGDYITPRLNSRPADRPNETTVPFFEKPIMVYWLCAASLRLFGFSEWAARLPVALAALLVTMVITSAGQRWFGRRAGLLAGTVYAVSPMTIVDARQMTTDGLLVLWFTLALMAFWGCRRAAQARLHEEPEPLLRFWGRPLLFWTMCALSVLTKGAVGLLLPLMVIAVYLLISRYAVRMRQLTTWKATLASLRPLVGLLLFFAIVTPWHLLIRQAGGHDAQGRTFVQEYVIRQHIGRFKGLDTVHNAPPYTYLVYFLAFFFPWACFTPAAFRFAPGKKRPDLLPSEPAETPPAILGGVSIGHEVAVAQESLHRFLLVWFWAIFVFFSLGAAKLPTYIAPAYPAAALLVGRWLDRALATTAVAQSVMARSLRRGTAFATVLALLLVIAAALAPRFAPPKSPIPPDVARAGLHLALTLFIGCLVAGLCFLRGDDVARRRQAGVGTLAAMMIVLIGIGCTEGYALATRDILRPYQSLAAAARADAEAGLPILYYHIIPRRPTMLFYAGYSPLERKETPMLPFLRRYLPPTAPEADVITSRSTLDELLRAEIAAAPDASFRILKETGDNRKGWVLLRVTARPDNGIKSSDVKLEDTSP